MSERADKREANTAVKVTLRGRVLNVGDPSPVAIARALRRNKQEKLDAKRAREAKLAGH